MSYPEQVDELNRAIEARNLRIVNGDDEGEYVIKEEYDRLEAQLAHFLKVAGATIDANGDLVFSAAGYSAWTKRKGNQRTREIYAENGHLQGQILGLQSLIKGNKEIMLMALGKERGELVEEIEKLNAELATARKDAFEKCKQAAQDYENLTYEDFVDKYGCGDISDAIHRMAFADTEAIEAASK